MLKLFRNIRPNLLMENRTSKPVLPIGPPDHGSRAGRYFKYAIGEIIKCPFRDYLLVALNIKTAHCAFRYKI
ncbi:MAG: hypothetical protein IPO98_12830 [Saprospiraceae bacterium]|nr:hypothetical protein [Saprospiraceae bacterium]